MSKNREAAIRYRVLNNCLKNKFRKFPTKEELRQACEEEIFGTSEGIHICHSTIEKDIFAMRLEHDAPIAYSKREKGYYYATRYGNSVSEKRLTALQTWLDLQQGEVISLAALNKLYFYIDPSQIFFKKAKYL